MKLGCVLNHSVSSILTQCAYEILIHFPAGSADDQYNKMLLFLPKTWSDCVAALCIKQQETEPRSSLSFKLSSISIPPPSKGKYLSCCLRETLGINLGSINYGSQTFVFPFKFQNFLRNQNNKNNYNLVCETLQFLDCICGSTTGGLGLLGLYINEQNVGLINQTVESLTEYCQGPCHENQVTPTASSWRPFLFYSL